MEEDLTRKTKKSILPKWVIYLLLSQVVLAAVFLFGIIRMAPMTKSVIIQDSFTIQTSGGENKKNIPDSVHVEFVNLRPILLVGYKGGRANAIRRWGMQIELKGELVTELFKSRHQSIRAEIVRLLTMQNIEQIDSNLYLSVMQERLSNKLSALFPELNNPILKIVNFSVLKGA